jgi:Spy/CpxP family protein refolding chaperone
MTGPRLPIVLIIALCLSGQAFADGASHQQQPYADLKARSIKALSDGQIADLEAGRGMGYALAAELNGYPGPVHVLEHADALELSPQQLRRTEQLYQAMKTEAVSLGVRLIAREAELDQLFRTETADPASLEAATDAIATIEGALRATHLRYHLAMKKALTPEQVERYAALRGYAGGSERKHRHGRHAR